MPLRERVRRSKVAARVRGKNPNLHTTLLADPELGREITVCWDVDAIAQCQMCQTPVHIGYTPIERRVFVALDGSRLHFCVLELPDKERTV